MRYAITVALVLAASLLAAGCKDSESPAQKTPSNSTPTAVRPEPVGPVPEGVLLVQREGQPDTTFGIGSDGGVEDFGKGFSAAASPDGRSVAFLRGSAENPSELVILSAGGEERFSDTASGTIWLPLSWSPDGSQLAYAMSDDANGELSHVYTVKADGSGRRLMTRDDGSYNVVGWTEDGQLLVASFGGARGQSRLLVIGEESRELALPEGSGDVGLYPQLSPDRRRLAVYGGSLEEGVELWVVEMDTGKSRLVAEMGCSARQPAEERYVSAAPPAAPLPHAPAAMLKGLPPVAWSPDGSHIAYNRSETNDKGVMLSELHVVNIESGTDTLVNRGGSWGETWSPDSRYLAVLREAPVLLWQADGSTKELSEAAEHALWASDGTLVLVVAFTGVIKLVDPDTSRVSASATEAGEEIRGLDVAIQSPAWSPGGRYLALATSPEGGGLNVSSGSLYVVDTRTAEATLVLDKGSFFPVAWLRS